MNLIKKFLIILIILLFSYILYRLLLKRALLLKEIENPQHEPFMSESFVLNEVSSLQSMTNAESELPLKEFFIKASYNSAFTGNFTGDFVTMETLDSVLEKGCRFVDFEVYYIKNAPYVSYSTDNTFSTIETENTLLLDNVLSRVISTGFSTKVSNNNDPLFIQLRIKSNNNDIYKMVAKSVDYILKDKLYKGKIDEKTQLKDLLGKVVLIVDKTISKDYYGNYSKCKQEETQCYDLTNYVNIDAGSEFLRTYRYNQVLSRNTNPPQIKDDNVTTDIKYMQVVLPDLDNKIIKNPDYTKFVVDYGCQIIAYRFYNNDDGLQDYEKLFKDNKCAFVRMNKAINFSKTSGK